MNNLIELDLYINIALIVYIGDSQRGAHAPPVEHSNILVRHTIFWWGWLKEQVNGLSSFLQVNCSKILNMFRIKVGKHQNFKNSKVGHDPKSVGNHWSICFEQKKNFFKVWHEKRVNREDTQQSITNKQ